MAKIQLQEEELKNQFEPLKPGKYNAKVSKVEFKVDSTGVERWNMELQIEDHNRRIWPSLSWDPTEKTSQKGNKYSWASMSARACLEMRPDIRDQLTKAFLEKKFDTETYVKAFINTKVGINLSIISKDEIDEFGNQTQKQVNRVDGYFAIASNNQNLSNGSNDEPPADVNDTDFDDDVPF